MNSFAVIGLGNISDRHRKNIRLLYPNAKIISMSASGRMPEEPVDNMDLFVGSLKELISNQPEMVIVASPASLHAKHSIPLIKAGIPLLIEKPVATNIQDSNDILVASEKYKVPVAVGYCLRYLSSSLFIKRLIEQNSIGNIYNVFVEVGQYLPDWRPNKNYQSSVSANEHLGGGALLELSHELDYTQWLLGRLKPHSAILRSSKELGLKVEDLVDALASNETDTVVSLHLDFLQKLANRKCRIIGSTGSIEWDLIKNEVTLATKETTKKIFSEPEWDKNLMYLNMLEDFIGLIEGKANQCITVKEAHQTVKFVEQVKHLVTQEK